MSNPTELLAGSGAHLPAEPASFLERTARSISEVQPGLDTIPELVVFLEVLGYTNKTASQNGFENLFDLAEHLYPVLDHYVDREETKHEQQESMLLPVPSVGRRLARGLGLVFPWLGSLAVLLFFGVSLWLVFGLPLSITTALIVGLFFGLLLGEGPVQLFQRIFTFYYEQYNLSEVKRALGRSFRLACVMLLLLVGTIYLSVVALGVPLDLAELSMVAGGTILFHRVGYIIVYSMKRYAQVVASYAAALGTLVFIYTWAYNLIPETLTRYLVSLAGGIIVLSVAPAYYGYRVLTARSAYNLDDSKRNPLNAAIVNRRTVMSSFGIQFWEGLPYFLFGMLCFAMLFGDRLMSWLLNPKHVANGIPLPLVFNSTYHLGADVALLVIFPAAVVQFVIISPISEQLSNLVTKARVADTAEVDTFLRYRYGLTVSVSAGVAAAVALLLIIFSHRIETIVGGSGTSIFVLQVASIANVFMTVFMANSLFLVFMNKMKALAGIAGSGVLILALAGLIASRWGYQDVVFAYLLAATVSMAVSYQFVVWALDRPGSLFFSRYI